MKMFPGLHIVFMKSLNTKKKNGNFLYLPLKSFVTLVEKLTKHYFTVAYDPIDQMF